MAISSAMKRGGVIAGVAIGAVALILITKPVPAPAVVSGNTGALVAEAATYDFGAVPLSGGLVRTAYAVRNTGAEPLTINDVWTSCMCTTAIMRRGGEIWGPFGMPGHGPRRGVSLTLAPGEETEVEVVFDPAAHGPAGVGPVMRAVFLDSTAGDPLELAFTATVTP